MNSLPPQQQGLEGGRKQGPEGGIENIEPARVGAERRQHQTQPVGREATTHQASAPDPDGGLRMQMSGDLAGRATGGRFVAKSQGSDLLQSLSLQGA